MGRIMQVIDKRSNFTSGTVDLKLYQTNFVGLTKVITDVPGQTVLNATEGQNVGYQFFHDLCLKQLDTRNCVDKFKPVYNAEIDKKKPTVNDLLPFSYSWKSCVDYRSQIVSGDKADYRLFQKVVNAEKELYDYRLYVSDHIKRNCDIMANWGMTRLYGSCTESMTGDLIEMRGTQWFTYTVVCPSYITVKKLNPDRSDFYQPQIFGINNIPLGETIEIIVTASNGCKMTYTVTRHKLNDVSDDGYFTNVVTAKIEGSYEGIRGASKPITYTGKKSPHFTKTTGVYDLEFFRTRKLI